MVYVFVLNGHNVLFLLSEIERDEREEKREGEEERIYVIVLNDHPLLSFEREREKKMGGGKRREKARRRSYVIVLNDHPILSFERDLEVWHIALALGQALCFADRF